MQRKKAIAVYAAGAAILSLTLAACGGGSGSANTSTSGSASGASSSATGGSPAAAKEITFWGWAPGYDKAVEAFNSSQSAIKVKYEEISPGAKGGYEKMLNSVKANQGTCLAQVGYETLTSFAAQGALEDVSSYAKSSESEFAPGAWNSVKIGEAVYGAPVDQGPMTLFYNKKVFEKYGIAVPTTWAEYQAAGKTLKEKSSGKVSLTSSYLNYDFAGFNWQASAPWFGVEGDSWKVSISSDATNKVSAYWDGLVTDGVISKAPMCDQSWYTGLSDGTIATHVGAVWIAGILKGDAKGGSGDWAVAPMPQWNASDTAVGNVGGSATAVLKGCSDPEAAWTFAHWMSTDKDAFAGLVDSAALYPAATALLDLPALSKGDPYFGGQKIFDVFKDASGKVVTGWTWGPNMPETVKTLDDQLGKAWSGTQTFEEATKATQEKTVSDLKAQGLSVAE